MAVSACGDSSASKAENLDVAGVARDARADALQQAEAAANAVDNAGPDAVASARARQNILDVGKHGTKPTDEELMAAYCEQTLGGYVQALSDLEHKPIEQLTSTNKEVAKANDSLTRLRAYITPRVLRYAADQDSIAIAIVNAAKQKSISDMHRWGDLIGDTPPDQLRAKIQSSPLLQSLQRRSKACRELDWLPNN
jgi:hypothetical protein